MDWSGGLLNRLRGVICQKSINAAFLPALIQCQRKHRISPKQCQLLHWPLHLAFTPCICSPQKVYLWCGVFASADLVSARTPHFSQTVPAATVTTASCIHPMHLQALTTVGPVCVSSKPFCHPVQSFCGQCWVASQYGLRWVLDTMTWCAQPPLCEHKQIWYDKNAVFTDDLMRTLLIAFVHIFTIICLIFQNHYLIHFHHHVTIIFFACLLSRSRLSQ